MNDVRKDSVEILKARCLVRLANSKLGRSRKLFLMSKSIKDFKPETTYTRNRKNIGIESRVNVSKYVFFASLDSRAFDLK